MSSTKIVDVAVGVILKPDGSLLLGSRPEGKPYPGWWELPGGKLEPGETVLEALARELREELAIETRESTPWVTYVHAYSHLTVRLYFCRVTRWDGEPRGAEGQELRWVRVAPDTNSAEGVSVAPDVCQLLAAAWPPLRWLGVPATYAITAIGSPAGLPAFLNRLDTSLARGLRLIQFREPDWPGGPDAASLRQALEQVLARARAAGARVLVNSRHPRAWWRDANGVHLRAVDLGQPLAERPKGSLVGASVHNAAELEQARLIHADFAVLGPVLPTASHPGQPGLGWRAFHDLTVNSAPGMPVLALGGMSENLRAQAEAHSAHGLAGISGFWQE